MSLFKHLIKVFQPKPIWTRDTTVAEVDFKKYARIKTMRCMADPIENWDTGYIRINHEHYARVLEAKAKNAEIIYNYGNIKNLVG